MGRCTRYLNLIVICGLAILGSGCATARMGSPFAARASKSDTDSPFKSGDKTADASADKNADKTVAKTAKPTAADASTDASTPDKSPSGKSSVEHDGATLALIDQETRDATLEEREALFRELKGQHPDVVQHILRVRRMGLNYQKQQLAEAEQTLVPADGTLPGGPPPGNAFQGGQISPITLTGGAGRTTPALGASTPWSSPPPGGGHSTGGYPTQPSSVSAGRLPTPHSNIPADPAAAYAQPPVQTAQAGTAYASHPPAVTGHNPLQPHTPGTANQPAVAGQAPVPPPGNSAIPHDEQRPGGMLHNLPFRNNVAQVAGAMNNALGNLIPGQYDPAAAQPGVQRANFNGGTVAGYGPGPVPGEVPAAPASWPDTLLRLISIAEAEANAARTGPTEAEQHAWLEKQVHLRLLYLMAGQQERALQAIPGLEPADQEFWQQTFWALANYFDFRTIPSSADRATQTVSQLTTAVLRLQEKANLSLRNVTFCHKIANFGNYERFPRDEFSPGQPVLLYSEVENFHSEPTQDGQYRTILASSLEIYKPGPNGALVEKIQLPSPATEDICRNHRRDYFHSYEFTIPSRLALGPHVLKLTVEDQLSRKVASYTLNFTVK